MKKIVIVKKVCYAPKRGNWGLVNPITRVIPDKTKYNRKTKHKEKY